MLLYAIIMFVMAALFAGLGVSIRGGNINLIHDYHRMRVKPEQRRAYGRAFAKGMFTIGAAMLLSGIAALCGESKAVAVVSLTVLVLGLAAGLILIVRAQKQYNGGLF